MKDKILITSATGKTGYEATIQLLKAGYTVRIFVRSRNRRALDLEKMGAEISIGDLTNYTDLTNALKDVKRVYYCYPPIPDLLGSTKMFIRAAKKNNIEAIVFMGQWLAEFDNQKSILTNNIKEAYLLLEQSGLNVVYFIPGFFAENFNFVTEFSIQFGLMPAPIGNGKNPAPSNEDMGLVVACLLKNPTPYFGKRLRPTGPKSLSPQEMAAVLSKVIGRKVSYVNMPEWMALKALFATAKEFKLDPFLISQTRHYFKEYQDNKFDVGGPTNVVKEVAGKEPDDFETIVEKWVYNSPYRKRNLKNWLSAMKKFMAIPFQPIPGIKELEKLNK